MAYQIETSSECWTDIKSTGCLIKYKYLKKKKKVNSCTCKSLLPNPLRTHANPWASVKKFGLTQFWIYVTVHRLARHFEIIIFLIDLCEWRKYY